MKSSIFLSTILFLTFASCNNNRTQVSPKKEIPKALDDKSIGYEIMSRRDGDDLLEDLYKELVDKDVELKRFEEKIEALSSSERDSTSSFEKFNGKIKSYFKVADDHYASEIKDSLLRDKMKALIASNLTKYNSRVAKHNELFEIIEARQTTISDLHNVLKIVKTLPVIEKYQKDNLPGTKSLEGFIKEQNQTINMADTLINK